MDRDDIAEKVEKGKQKLQDLQEDTKEKVRETADTAKEKARETAGTAKERPARTGGIIAALAGGLAVVWGVIRRRRRSAGESSA